MGLSEANPVSTPADPHVKLVKDDGHSKKVDAVQYQSMVGSLLHAARSYSSRHSSSCWDGVKV